MQLLSNAMGVFQMELWLGLLDAIPEEEVAPHGDKVVDDFLRPYGAES